MKRNDSIATSKEAPHSEQLSQIVGDVPREIWEEIFSYFIFVGKNFEQFRILSCVSAKWSKIVHDLILIRYKDNYCSDWHLSHFTHITTLDYGEFFWDFIISDRSLSKLTNLVLLTLKEGPKWPRDITNESVSKLVNLTHLSLLNTIWLNQFSLDQRFRPVNDESIMQLTNLMSHDIPENNFITDASISKLSNLTSINLHDSSKITDESVSRLKNPFQN